MTEAREARGMSTVELASLIGISHQAISKFESGKSAPGYETLERLSEILKLPVQFFIKSPSKNTITEADVVFFRSRAAATVKSKKVHSTSLKWLNEIHEYLEEILEFPNVDIPQLISNEKYEPLEFGDIDSLSSQVRKHWGLGNGPISDLVLLLEKKGVVAARDTFSSMSIDACSVWSKKSRPLLLLSNDKTASRSRFDAAHELGHWVLHSHLKPNEFFWKENYKSIEKEANRFASSFLLPAASFGNEVYSTSMDHLIALKKRWKVSIAAIAYRANKLGVFSEFQHVNVRQKLAKNNWLKSEPLDDELPFEEPTLLKQSVELIIQHAVKSKHDIINDLKLSREEIEALTNVGNGFLLEESNVGNIVSFKPRKG
nr:XRE family transcriptional regulator [Cohnella sp. GbtcB17]